MTTIANPLRFPEIVSNSNRKDVVKCQKLAHWKYERGLVPAGGKNVHLHAGGAFAAGLEAARLAFYRDGKSHEDAVVAGIEAVNTFYGDYAVSKDNVYKSKERMAGALAFYFQERRMDEDELQPVVFPDGTLGIEINDTYEIPVKHPVTGKNLIYSFRFDMLAQDSNGDYWVVDEKTTNKLGDSWAFQWDLDSQMTSYCLGGKKLLKAKGLDPDRLVGAVINGVSILKYDYGHMRVPTMRMDWEIERWFNQMVKDFQDWSGAYQLQNHNQILDHACALYNAPCEYAPLCKSREPHKLFEGSYEVRFYNPITREETK